MSTRTLASNQYCHVLSPASVLLGLDRVSYTLHAGMVLRLWHLEQSKGNIVMYINRSLFVNCFNSTQTSEFQYLTCRLTHSN